MRNTGKVNFAYLEEYDVSTGLATGNYKNNTPGDPDYVQPYIDFNLCPLDDIEQNISTVQVTVANKSQQFVSFSSVKVKPDNSVYAFNGSFAKGPTQSQTATAKMLLGEFVTLEIITSSSSLNQPIYLELRWGSETGTLLATSGQFLAGSANWIVQDIPITYSPLNQEALLFVVVKQNAVAPTTTTTTTPPTTTTTTTTMAPIGDFVIRMENITCVGSPEEGVIYSSACSGNIYIALSQPSLLNRTSGFIRFKDEYGQSDSFVMTDFIGNSLTQDEVRPVTIGLQVVYNEEGINDPASAPNGRVKTTSRNFVFEYSIDGESWDQFIVRFTTNPAGELES